MVLATPVSLVNQLLVSINFFSDWEYSSRQMIHGFLLKNMKAKDMLEQISGGLTTTEEGSIVNMFIPDGRRKVLSSFTEHLLQLESHL